MFSAVDGGGNGEVRVEQERVVIVVTARGCLPGGVGMRNEGCHEAQKLLLRGAFDATSYFRPGRIFRE